MLDERLLIVRVQFSTMRGHERDTWYETDGRIDFTNSKGLVGFGLPRMGAATDQPHHFGWEPKGARWQRHHPIVVGRHSARQSAHLRAAPIGAARAYESGGRSTASVDIFQEQIAA